MFLVAILCSLSLAGQTPDNIMLSANFSGKPLKEVLTTLGEEYQLRFSYLETTVADLAVDCRFERAKWDEIVNCLFASNGIEAEVLGNGQITLRPGAARDWNICLRTESLSGEVLPFVTVGNPLRGISLVTDGDGLLRATVRLRAKDSLEMHYLGYASQRLAPGQLRAVAECPVVQLRPSSIELAAVTVTEYLSPGINATADGRRVILDPSAVDPAPGFSDREIFRDLARLPGINSIQESAGNLSIRGGTPDQNLVLWDNIPVYSSGHYLGMISNFSTELVGTVDVWRGRAEAEYGGHVAGLIRMTTDRTVRNRFAATAGVSLLQLQGATRIPLIRDKSDIQLAFKGNLPALLTGPAYNSYRDQALQGYRVGETTGTFEDFQFGEFNGRWQYNPGAGHAFTLSGFRQGDDLNYDLTANNGLVNFTDALRSVNAGASLHYVYQPRSRRRTEFWLTQTDFSNEGNNTFSNRIANTGLRRSNGIRESSVKALHTLELKPGNRWQVGIQGQSYRYDFSLLWSNFLTGTLRETTVRAGRAYALSPFTSYGWESGPFQAQVGLRLPYFQPTKKVYFEPRLSGSYLLGNTWRVKAGLGMNNQFSLQILDLDQERVSQAAPLWTLADGNNFPVPTGLEVSGGLSGSPGPWLFDLEVYYKRVKGLSATALNLEIAGFAEGNSRARGADLLVKRRYGPWRSGLVYSLSRTTWFFPDIDNESFFADFNRPHQLELEQAYQRGPWRVSLAFHIQTGAPYTPTTVGLPVSGGGTLIPQLEYGPLNSLRLPDYQRLDLAVSYEWASRNPKRLSGDLTFSLLNLTAQENLLERNFSVARRDNPPPGEQRFYAKPFDRIGLGFTPNLSVRFRSGGSN